MSSLPLTAPRTIPRPSTSDPEGDTGKDDQNKKLELATNGQGGRVKIEKDCKRLILAKDMGGKRSSRSVTYL